MTFAKVIARAWSDDAYRAKLLSDPRAALNEVGVTIPENVTVRVVEDTEETRFLVLPKPPPQAGDQSLADLEQEAGVLITAPTVCADTLKCCTVNDCKERM